MSAIPILGHHAADHGLVPVRLERLRGRLRHVALMSPWTVAVVEAAVLFAVGGVLLSGATLASVAVAAVVRAHRTPLPTLTARPLHGSGRYLLDLIATFGIAVLVAGDAVVTQRASWLVVVAAGLLARVSFSLTRRLLARAFPAARRRLLLLTDRDQARAVADSLRQHPELGIDPCAVHLDGPPSVRRLATIVEHVQPDSVLYSHEYVDLALVDALDRLGPSRHRLLTPGERVPGDGSHPETIWSMRVASITPAPMDRPSWLARTAIERIVALIGLVLVSPLLAALAVGVKLESPGPVLFRQTRVGLHGREFTIFKFRSMPVDHDPGHWNAAYDAEPTRLGRVMRELSLDELPQLFNVLRGDMSLIGPRPELPRFVSRFEETVEGYERRHRMPVGMTGWAQVHGLRGDTSIEDRVAFDNNYIDDWSSSRDLSILVRTARQLLPERMRRTSRVDDDSRVIDLVGLVEAAAPSSTADTTQTADTVGTELVRAR